MIRFGFIASFSGQINSSLADGYADTQPRLNGCDVGVRSLLHHLSSLVLGAFDAEEYLSHHFQAFHMKFFHSHFLK